MNRMLVALLASFLAGPAAAASTTAFLGGAIYTLNDKQPWATALVVDSGHIVYVGDERGARPFLAKASRVVRLNGRMMLPGFHDAHAHPMSASLRFLRCQFGGKSTRPALFAAIRACAASHPDAAWLVGYEFPSKAFEKQPLTRAELDALVPDRPAYIANETGFGAWANSRALATAEIDTATVPAGILNDDALNRVHARIPRATEAEYRAALKLWMDKANALGITSVFDAAASPPMVEAYHAADLAGDLKLRVVAAQLVDPKRGMDQVNEMTARRDSTRGQRFRADAAKIFLDGEIDQHTAALLAPYADKPDTKGELFVQPDVLNPLVKRLDSAGFLIHIHVMGDAAVRAGLDALEGARLANGPADRRPQLAHVALAEPEDTARFGAIGVTANFSPGWFRPDDPALAGIEAALGPQRSRWLYSIARVADTNGRIVMSSDWPATSMNPLEGIEVAVTRQAPGGRGPINHPEQCVSLALALRAYTADAAWVVREDEMDGSLEVGKAADLIVLDRNLFKVRPGAIHQARVLLTLLDGEPVFRSRGFKFD
ncbi:MAG TPA: amidohydrolase [Rhizomicrobium sp.]|nr:amidohydrolase [Rhizomicrobium sp.]